MYSVGGGLEADSVGGARDVRDARRVHHPAVLQRPLVAHLQTTIIQKLGFNQNYYTFTEILIFKIVMSSKFS